MRMEQLRAMGATERANRREVGTGGKESIEQWEDVRAASIQWKLSEGWHTEHAIGYTLLTGCNGAALARSVRERSSQYAASLHLIASALSGRVNPNQPAPDVFYTLLGSNGLATTDSSWAALLGPTAAPGLRFVITSSALVRAPASSLALPPAPWRLCQLLHATSARVLAVSGPE